MENGSRRVRFLVACAAACVAVAAFAGCSAQEPTSTSSAASATGQGSGPTTVATASQDKTVTFPSGFFELKGVHDPQAFLEARGYAGVVANEDGTYTATVAGDAYTELVDEAFRMATAAIDALPDDPDYPGVVAVDYDPQFATVTVSFSTTELSAQDALVSYVPGEAACMYQQIAGLPVDCDVILVGSDGSELANTVFPVKTAASETAAASA